jgi:hypothetical protein
MTGVGPRRLANITETRRDALNERDALFGGVPIGIVMDARRRSLDQTRSRRNCMRACSAEIDLVSSNHAHSIMDAKPTE